MRRINARDTARPRDQRQCSNDPAGPVRSASPWERARIVRAEGGQLCLVDIDGALLAHADSLVQLIDAVELGVLDKQDAGETVFCALAYPAGSPGAPRCNCAARPCPSSRPRN